MNLIIEALFIGLYTSLFSIFPIGYHLYLYLYLFFVGFFKHYLGYYLGFHDFYCNNNKNNKNKYIITDSILEGFYFIIIGNIIFKFLNFSILIRYIIISDFINLHKLFKYYRCL